MSLKLLTWNIMGKRPLVTPGVRNMERYITSHDLDVICLQENPHGERILRKQNRDTFPYKVTSSRMVGFLHNANTIFSKYPITNSGVITFSLKENRDMQNLVGMRDSHICIWADIAYATNKVIRIYNCHLKLIAATVENRLRAVTQVFHHATSFDGPVIICGDMNTVMPQGKISRNIIRWFNSIEEGILPSHMLKNDERYVFRDQADIHNFYDLLDITKPTWAFPRTSIELFRLKLDWVLVKNGMKGNAKKGPYTFSDHAPIHAEIEIE